MRSSKIRRAALRAVVPAIVAIALASPMKAHVAIDRQIVDLKEQIAKEPENASLYLRRGELHRVHQEWDLAEGDYHRARDRDPDLATVDYCLGRMLLESGRPAQALPPLERLLAAHPDHVEALVTRARALDRLGRHIEAAEDFEKAIAQSRGDTPPRPTYYIERAQALAAAGGEHLDSALAGLDEGIDRLGPIVSLQLHAIDLEVESRRYDAALSRLDALTVTTQRRESMLVRRGEILKTAGRLEEARQAYLDARSAIEALPRKHRGKRAVRDLEASVNAALIRLGTGTGAPGSASTGGGDSGGVGSGDAGSAGVGSGGAE